MHRILCLTNIEMMFNSRPLGPSQLFRTRRRASEHCAHPQARLSPRALIPWTYPYKPRRARRQWRRSCPVGRESAQHNPRSAIRHRRLRPARYLLSSPRPGCSRRAHLVNLQALGVRYPRHHSFAQTPSEPYGLRALGISTPRAKALGAPGRSHMYTVNWRRRITMVGSSI